MKDAGIGRLLVASLHQAIVDRLPDRLEFYESWLNPQGLRDGTIGLAPFNAVLSFLRTEGPAYDLVTATAGEYAADWFIEELRPFRRRMLGGLPGPLRRRAALKLVRVLVARTSTTTRARTRVSGGRGWLEIRNSLFCVVREPTAYPLCRFYAAAAARALRHAGVDADAMVVSCRAAGQPHCGVEISMQVAAVQPSPVTGAPSA